jgi:hypothetical protein
MDAGVLFCNFAQINQAVVSLIQIMAHEVGHNLGMNHDFDGSGAPRYDSKGVSCRNVLGIMDYDQVQKIYFSDWHGAHS